MFQILQLLFTSVNLFFRPCRNNTTSFTNGINRNDSNTTFKYNVTCLPMIWRHNTIHFPVLFFQIFFLFPFLFYFFIFFLDGYVISGENIRKRAGKPVAHAHTPFGVTSGSPVGHEQWYLYYSTTIVRGKWRHKRINAGKKNDVTEEKKTGEGDMTSLPVTSDQGRFWSGPLPVRAGHFR